MRRLLIIPLVIMVGSAWIMVAVATHQATNVIAPAIADSMAVDSPMEQVLAAREADAAAGQGGGGWWAFGLLLCGGLGIAAMAVGTPFLKQGRLTLKSLKRSSGGRRPSSTTITQIPTVPRVPQLMDGGQWQDEQQSQQF